MHRRLVLDDLRLGINAGRDRVQIGIRQLVLARHHLLAHDSVSTVNALPVIGYCIRLNDASV